MGIFSRLRAGDLSDSVLMERFKTKGDLRYVGALHQRYATLIFGVCMKYLGNAQDSEDATIAVFEELVVKLPKDDVANFKSWLYVLTKNYCLQQLRRRKIKTADFSEEFMHIPDVLHPDDEALNSLRTGALKECLDKLPAKQKTSIEMFYYDSKSYAEIATALGIDKDRVRSFIQNGRRNLKNCIQSKK